VGYFGMRTFWVWHVQRRWKKRNAERNQS